uniref:Uncharacterized protein n=1 Tax=Heterorhabditis bacteriophora TaxID=37862 RepID=A0A1I7X027_HETBA
MESCYTLMNLMRSSKEERVSSPLLSFVCRTNTHAKPRTRCSSTCLIAFIWKRLVRSHSPTKPCTRPAIGSSRRCVLRHHSRTRRQHHPSRNCGHNSNRAAFEKPRAIITAYAGNRKVVPIILCTAARRRNYIYQGYIVGLACYQPHPKELQCRKQMVECHRCHPNNITMACVQKSPSNVLLHRALSTFSSLFRDCHKYPIPDFTLFAD